MTPQRILVLDRTPASLHKLPSTSDKQESKAVPVSDLITHTTATISEALNWLKQGGYDAVFCRIYAPEEVSFLVRIKKVAPTIPIVALTTGNNPGLDDLARDSGADDVQFLKRMPGAGESAPAPFDFIARAKAALTVNHDLRIQGRELVARQRQLIARSRILSQEWTDQVKQAFKGFLPLVVEDNPDQVFFLKRALEKASLPCPLQIMTDGSETIAYLSGEGDFADRDRHPLPTLMILDLRLPKRSGLEVLQWVRRQPHFLRLPIFILTTSPEHFETAMALGASDYFTKPMESGGLLEVVRAMAVRWWFFQKACEP